MHHTMRLAPDPFRMIRSGQKTIELRLYDEKRQSIRIGDEITFINTENALDTVTVRVTALHLFDTFDELYRSLPLLRCGYTESDIASASPRDMELYYTKQQQAAYGVVGIEITLIT